MASYSTQQICELVGGELHGPGELTITGVEHIDAAGDGHLTFIGDDRHAGRWPTSKASAALVSRGLDVAGGDGRAIIVVDSADLAMSTALALFAPPPPVAALPDQGAHACAVIDPSATIGRGVRIGAHCVVGPNTTIGAQTVLYPGASVLDECRIGEDCVLWPGVVIRERCTIGDRCVLHPNVTIGADGFGYRRSPDGTGLVKIPQIGTVEIGDDVEIGAGTCVDRGKFSATLIGSGSKIDNLCQIAHNCRLGRHVILAGQVGLAGSVTIGDAAMLGGKAAVTDHATIGAGAVLLACSAVMGDVPAGEVWGGLPAREKREAVREYAAIRKLPDLIKAMRPRPGS